MSPLRKSVFLTNSFNTPQPPKGGAAKNKRLSKNPRLGGDLGVFKGSNTFRSGLND